MTPPILEYKEPPTASFELDKEAILLLLDATNIRYSDDQFRVCFPPFLLRVLDRFIIFIPRK
jgi:hypothetical protein